MGVPLRRLRAPSPETDIRNGRLARLGPDVPQWLLSRPRCAPSSCRVQAWGGGIGVANHRDPLRCLRQVLRSAQEGGKSRSVSLSVGHNPAPPIPYRGRTHLWRSARPAPDAPPRASTKSPRPPVGLRTAGSALHCRSAPSRLAWAFRRAFQTAPPRGRSTAWAGSGRQPQERSRWGSAAARSPPHTWGKVHSRRSS